MAISQFMIFKREVCNSMSIFTILQDFLFKFSGSTQRCIFNWDVKQFNGQLLNLAEQIEFEVGSNQDSNIWRTVNIIPYIYIHFIYFNHAR